MADITNENYHHKRTKEHLFFLYPKPFSSLLGTIDKRNMMPSDRLFVENWEIKKVKIGNQLF